MSLGCVRDKCDTGGPNPRILRPPSTLFALHRASEDTSCQYGGPHSGTKTGPLGSHVPRHKQVHCSRA